MAAADKSRVVYGLMIKAESADGTYTAPSTSTNGVVVDEFPEVGLQYGVSGERPGAPGTGGTQDRVAPSAPMLVQPIKIASRGAGQAYAANTHAQENVFLKMAGFDLATTTTGGSEKDRYTPTAYPTNPYISGSADFYTEQEKWKGNGGHCDWTYEVENGKPAIWTFDTKFRLEGTPAADTSTAQTIVYTSVLPHTVSPLVITYNSVSTMPCEKVVIKGNRVLTDRVKGAYGVQPGRRNPTMVITVERPLLSTANFFSDWSAGTARAASLVVGSVQYFKDTWTFGRVQVVDVKPSADGDRALLDISCELKPSSLILNDDIILDKN